MRGGGVAPELSGPVCGLTWARCGGGTWTSTTGLFLIRSPQPSVPRSGTAPADGWWSIWPSIELGNGKTVRGEPVKLPVSSDDTISLGNEDAGGGVATSPS
jgi:hypothetical protein